MAINNKEEPIPDLVKEKKRGVGPVKGRWVILFFLFLVTVINYIDRSNMSIALPHLRDDLGLSPTQLGLVLSAFSWAYVIAQLPGGWILDKLGAKVSYAWAVFLWSLATMGMSLVNGIGGIIGARMVVGVAEAPAYPANNALVTRWFPKRERGRATSMFITGQYLGMAVGLPIMSWIGLEFGWRWIFIVTGVPGLILIPFWLYYVKNRPPRPVEIAEERIEEEPKPKKRKTTWADIRYLLSKRRLWGLYISQFATNGVMWFFLTWFPTYLQDEKGIDAMKSGFMASVPYLAALCGVLFSGWWSDRMIGKGVSVTWARKGPMMIGFILSATIIAANYTNNAGLVVAIMSFAFFAQGMTAIGWSLASDIMPLQLLGISGGVFNFFTNLGGATVPLIIGVILGDTGSFTGALVFVGALALVGLLAYIFLIDKVERLDPDAPRGAVAL